MNFDDAIKAHANWKLRLVSYIEGSSKEKLDPLVIRRDDACQLGQWIHSEAKKLAVVQPMLPELVQQHARFHERAAGIVRRVQAGERLDYQRELNDSEYSRLSTAVIGLLMKMKRLAP